MTITLRSRLILTFALFACAFIVLLSFVINQFASALFVDFVSDTADEQSRQAATFIAEQYSPEIGGFDVAALHAIAMSSARQGFFVTVETADGIILLEAEDFYRYAMRAWPMSRRRFDGGLRRAGFPEGGADWPDSDGRPDGADLLGGADHAQRREWRRHGAGIEGGGGQHDGAGLPGGADFLGGADYAEWREWRERRREERREERRARMLSLGGGLEQGMEAGADGEGPDAEERRRRRRRPRMPAQADFDGELRSRVFPMTHGIQNIGIVVVETGAPYFFTENQLAFMASLRRFLLGIGLSFALLSVVITALLANNLSKPILKAARAARQIAGGDWSARIPERQRTREIGEISRSLNHLAAALEDSDRRQKQLTTNVAHELRTPLTTLQGNMEAMIDGVWAPSPRRLASCHEEIVRLSRLVEDLGRLSLLEQKNLVLSCAQFDLQALLADLAEQFRPAALEKGVSVSLSAQESPIFADRDRLKQVFVNLLSNALKYTDKGGVEITVSETAASAGAGANASASGNGNAGGEYAISVADTGIGIHGDELPHVFERFFRSDKSRSRATGGAGIGLSIAGAIVSAHGGRMEAASEIGRGSVFTVFLPKCGDLHNFSTSAPYI